MRSSRRSEISQPSFYEISRRPTRSGFFNGPTVPEWWIIIGEEATPQSAREYATSEGIAAEQPVLTVTYTPTVSSVEEWQILE
ncbi:MAG: hypothetical protein ACR2IE_03980 [Candidatus Sumerlaeaceae bacterium]